MDVVKVQQLIDDNFGEFSHLVSVDYVHSRGGVEIFGVTVNYRLLGIKNENIVKTSPNIEKIIPQLKREHNTIIKRYGVK
jgi:hypothetical protein